MKNITCIDKVYNATFIEHPVHDMLFGDGMAFALYFTLKRFHNKEWGYACPSIACRKKENRVTQDLVSILGVTEPTIRKKIKLLEEKGLIRTEKVIAPTGNKKILFYIYQPFIVKEEDLIEFNSEIENKKAFVVGSYKDHER